jgi:hypothetical protein
MKDMKKTSIFALLLTGLGLLALDACENGQEDLRITLGSDYSEVLSTIEQSSRSLSEQMARIESLMRQGLADNQAAIEQLRQAVAALGGTLDEKLAAVEAAVKDETSSLETKLGLIDAVVASGFADDCARQELLLQAIASLGGTLDENLATIEEAVKAGTLSLETKLGLIEVAVESGFADNAAAQTLAAEALSSLGGTLDEKLAAIETAMANQATALSTKLALVEAAVAGGFADSQQQLKLLHQAVSSLNGTLAQKLESVRSAISNRTTSLETRLALIEVALEDIGTAESHLEEEMDFILQAITSLGGTLDEKLAAIETAVKSPATSLETKLATIETALKNGFVDDQTALGLVQTALDALKKQLGDVDDGLSKAIDDVSTAFGTLSTNVNVDMATALANILAAIQGLPDYGTILTAIQQALADLEKALG